nr:MAG TPA: ribosomal protein L9 [Siphoviridae sp. ctm488]DAP90389.1 MAG TPA: ribosomal protein L9 [Caudoviricetes sp.]
MDKKGSVFGSVSFKKVQKRIESIKQKTLFLQRFRKF